MTKLIRTFIFGSCGVHDAPNVLGPLRFTDPWVFGRLGFHCSPYALSSGATVQLYDFCVGERQLSEAMRWLTYSDNNQPIPATRALVDDTEIAFVELSTPVEPMVGEVIVNFNRIQEFIIAPLRAAGVERKLLSGWQQSLIGVRGDLKERADALLEGWPKNVPDNDQLRFNVRNLVSRRLDVDEMVRDLEILREKMRVPLALKLYDFKYMPDGRAIDWPAGFMAQQLEIARRMGLPTLNLSPPVAQLGAGRLIGNDMAHWRRDVLGLQAELMYDFWADMLGRSRLDTYPEWLKARPGLYAVLPEFLGEPARTAFPDIAVFPSRLSKLRGFKTRTPFAETVRREASKNVGQSARAAADAGNFDPLIELLNRELIGLHSRRLDDLGIEGSGLHAHYKARVEKGRMVNAEAEGVALKIIASHLPAYKAYAVLRAGLGELALLLAASGRKTIACEPEGARRSAIEAGRVHLEAAGLLAPGLLTIQATLAPTGPLEARVLGVGLDVTHVRDETAAAPLLERMRVFEALLISVRRFLRLREDEAEQVLLTETLHSMGFTFRREFPDARLSWFSAIPDTSRPQPRPTQGP